MEPIFHYLLEIFRIFNHKSFIWALSHYGKSSVRTDTSCIFRDPHRGLHKKTATLRSSGTCSGRSSAVGAMAYSSAYHLGCDENVYLSSSDQVFDQVFVALALEQRGPNSKDEPQGGNDEFLAAMFFSPVERLGAKHQV